MKVSLNWLKDYLPLSQSNEDISDALTALGLEASFESTGKSFTGVVLGKVLKCVPHENADKLSVCEVDVGDDENYTIVCGAPNVKSGIHVPIAKVGATLQNGEFKIKKTLYQSTFCKYKECKYFYRFTRCRSIRKHVKNPCKNINSKRVTKKRRN